MSCELTSDLTFFRPEGKNLLVESKRREEGFENRLTSDCKRGYEDNIKMY